MCIIGLFAVFAMSNIPACEAFFLLTWTKEEKNVYVYSKKLSKEKKTYTNFPLTLSMNQCYHDYQLAISLIYIEKVIKLNQCPLSLTPPTKKEKKEKESEHDSQSNRPLIQKPKKNKDMRKRKAVIL